VQKFYFLYILERLSLDMNKTDGQKQKKGLYLFSIAKKDSVSSHPLLQKKKSKSLHQVPIKQGVSLLT
jgi:hypothetical protein